MQNKVNEANLEKIDNEKLQIINLPEVVKRSSTSQINDVGRYLYVNNRQIRLKIENSSTIIEQIYQIPQMSAEKTDTSQNKSFSNVQNSQEYQEYQKQYQYGTSNSSQRVTLANEMLSNINPNPSNYERFLSNSQVGLSQLDDNLKSENESLNIQRPQRATEKQKQVMSQHQKIIQQLDKELLNQDQKSCSSYDSGNKEQTEQTSVYRQMTSQQQFENNIGKSRNTLFQENNRLRLNTAPEISYLGQFVHNKQNNNKSPFLSINYEENFSESKYGVDSDSDIFKEPSKKFRDQIKLKLPYVDTNLKRQIEKQQDSSTVDSKNQQSKYQLTLPREKRAQNILLDSSGLASQRSNQNKKIKSQMQFDNYKNQETLKPPQKPNVHLRTSQQSMIAKKVLDDSRVASVLSTGRRYKDFLQKDEKQKYEMYKDNKSQMQSIMSARRSTDLSATINKSLRVRLNMLSSSRGGDAMIAIKH